MRLTFGTVPNVPLDVLAKNAAKNSIYPRIGPRSGVLAVVGAGPSVLGRVERLVRWEGDLWAINRAWKWCASRGIGATFFTVDGHPTIAELAHGAEKGVLSVTCDPTVFHGIEAPETFDVREFSGGPSSASHAPAIAIEAGYREITFFGCEGSYLEDGTTHINGKMNYADWFRVECNGKKFVTNPQMLIQTEYIAAMIRAAPEFLKEESGGLLRAMVADPTWSVTETGPEMTGKLVYLDPIDEMVMEATAAVKSLPLDQVEPFLRKAVEMLS